MAQKLSPAARRAKAARDLAFAKTPARKAKKAQNQRIGQRSDSDLHHDGNKVERERRKNPCPKGYDYDHKRQKCVTIKSNRGNQGEGTKKESGNNYKTD